jgi:alkanesulfonate monooxygenase SsuD/methylene tetrahydromethanopterin reductase-like flavin-dependent oxidoreductase (luciferase family)/putative sterol carrier protein
MLSRGIAPAESGAGARRLASWPVAPYNPAVRFGLFYEHQIPRPWEEDATERLLSDALEQVELADRLGIDYVWEVEHHFLEEYSHSSAPEVFLGAASQRTERIRLGHGIVQIPPAVNHPARVVERVATLDLISGGRVDFGTGESSSQLELGGFGVPREEKREQWEEAMDAITRMFVEEPFAGYDGRWISMPQRSVLPKPKQKPHPPLWVACTRRDTILMAARRGLGALSFAFVEPEESKEWADEYYELIASEECVPAGFSVNPNFAVVLPFMCHEDEETAIERGVDGAHFFGYSLAYYYGFGDHVPGQSNVWDHFSEHRDEMGFARKIVNPDSAPLGVKLLQEGLGSLRGAIGTPAQITELIERYEAAGVDQMIFVSQAGRNRHEHICESLELFAKEVLPPFAERADAREAERRAGLEEAIERALRRRAPARQAQPGYKVTPKGEPAPAEAIAAGRRASGDGRVPGEVEPAGDEAGDGGRPRRGLDPERLRRRLDRAGEAAFASLVRGRSDERLERMFRGPGLWVIFKGMERAFVPEKAAGFEGEVQYDLRSSSGTRSWVLKIANGRARTRRGTAEDPQLTMRVSLPDFIRMAAQEEHPPKLFLTGRIEVEGDFAVAGRLAEMFGQPGYT